MQQEKEHLRNVRRVSKADQVAEQGSSVANHQIDGQHADKGYLERKQKVSQWGREF